MTDWKAVGQRVREGRKAKGLTGAQLGAAAGIGGAERVSALEHGARPVTEENLAKVAEVLGLSLPYLRYGIAAETDADRLRTAGFSDGWRAALDQLAAATTALQAAEPGAALGEVLPPVVPVVGTGPGAPLARAVRAARADQAAARREAEVEEERALMDQEQRDRDRARALLRAASEGRKGPSGRRG